MKKDVNIAAEEAGKLHEELLRTGSGERDWEGIPRDVWDSARKATSLNFTTPIPSFKLLRSVAESMLADRNHIAAKVSGEISRSASVLRSEELAYAIARLIIEGK